MQKVLSLVEGLGMASFIAKFVSLRFRVTINPFGSFIGGERIRWDIEGVIASISCMDFRTRKLMRLFFMLDYYFYLMKRF